MQDPTSIWQHIPATNILVIARAPEAIHSNDEYNLLYIADNPAARQDCSQTPVVFKTLALTSPPSSLVSTFSHPGGACWEYRQNRSQADPHWHIIVSTGSGTGLAKPVWEQVLKPLLDHVRLSEGKDYALHFTTSESSVVEFTRDVLLPRANEGIAQAVVLMSGDGGIVDVVNTLLAGERSSKYKKPNISILPLGTGNALAHSAGLGSDNTLGLHSWIMGIPKELPLFAATFSPGARLLFDEARQQRPLHSFNGVPTAHGAVVCSWGLHAGLVADSDTQEYRRYGAERFKMAGKEALFPSDGSQPHTYKGRVSITWPGANGLMHTVSDEDNAYVVATLVSNLEKTFTVSPASKALDGRLRLVYFGPVSGDDAMEIMNKAYQGGRHVDDERVRYEEIAALEVHFLEKDARWRRVCIDGKIIVVEEGGWMRVQAGQQGVVDLIVPQSPG